MDIESNMVICHEIARQEGFNPFQCDVRITKRKSDGTPEQLVFFYPNGKQNFVAIPTIMYGQTEGYFWRKI